MTEATETPKAADVGQSDLEGVVGRSPIRTIEPTCALRIAKPIPDFSFIGGLSQDRLQQAWRCIEDGSIEWRDVEIVRIPYEEMFPPNAVLSGAKHTDKP